MIAAILMVGTWQRKGSALLVVVGALPALWIGLHDLFGPVSFSSQLLGGLYTAAGLCIVIGVAELARKRRVRADRPALSREGADNYGLASFLAAATSAIVALSVSLSAYGYRPAFVWIFGALAVADTAVAVMVVRKEHVKALSDVMKSSLLAGGTLVAIASFTYQNIYVPSDTEVGIEFASSTGRPLKVSHDIYLIPVHLTMTDRSSVGAVVATSLATVTGVYYAGHGRRYPPPGQMQERETSEGKQAIPAERPGSDLSDVFPGREHRTVLAATKLIGDGSQLVSGGTYVRSILVAVPRDNFKGLVIEQSIVYGSTSRLTLAANKPIYPPATERGPWCRNRVERLWRLRESELRSFTRGRQILVTNWCADRGSERVWAFVKNLGKTSNETIERNDRLYGLHSTRHDEEIILPSSSDPAPTKRAD